MRGYPDDFGQSIWPKYGNPNFISPVVVVGAGETKNILTLSLQGVVWGLTYGVTPVTDFANVTIKMAIDSVLQLDATCEAILASATPGIGTFPTMPFNIDKVAGLFQMINSKEFPVHDSVTVDIVNNSAIPVDGFASVMYYVIQ